MIAFREQKIENAIVYFSSEFRERKGYFPRQTWIYKFLALLDFRTLRKFGIPCLGLPYDAMQFGPVPTSIYNKREGSSMGDKYRFIKAIKNSQCQDGYRVETSAKPDLDFFSDNEMDVMDEIVEQYISQDVNLDTLIEDAHKEILSWKHAWDLAQREGRNKMSMEYSDEFPDIGKKTAEQLTPKEERFLWYKSISAMEECMDLGL